MHITLETDYAIRIVDYLTRNRSTVGAVEISEAASVPLRFAKNILQKLTKKRIINSHKGVYGGYELGRLPEDISLYDVLEATEGPIVLNRCLFEENRCTYSLNKQCPYHEIFGQLSIELENRLRGIKFSSIIYGRRDKKELMEYRLLKPASINVDRKTLS